MELNEELSRQKSLMNIQEDYNPDLFDSELEEKVFFTYNKYAGMNRYKIGDVYTIMQNELKLPLEQIKTIVTEYLNRYRQNSAAYNAWYKRLKNRR